MYFLQASATSIGIKALTYPSLKANWRDGNYHINNNEVEHAILTRAEFHQFF